MPPTAESGIKHKERHHDVVEKYLQALEAAVEVKDKEVIRHAGTFATHLYKEIHNRTEKASDEERASWNGRSGASRM